ncbi:MAG: thiamine-phosphate kinase [Bacteroidales bacterium]|nr:thiamine-phosphate kinase [Bacteroidales bacterium]
MMKVERFADIGRVQAIETLFKGTGYKPFGKVSFSPSSKGDVLSSGRLFTEGVDFNLVYFPLKHLGYKCVTAISGDLLAGLSAPRTLAVRIGISAKLDFAQIKELWEGMAASAKEHGYKDVDLDLFPSRNGLIISLSATGEVSKLTCARKPAPKSKDLLCLSGSVGGAYFGMRVLEREKDKFEEGGKQPSLEKYRMMVGSYLKPEISPYTVSQMLEEEIVPSWGVLVDRGLADAVKRMARATGLGAKVYADRIPFEGQSFDLGKILDVDPVSAAMNGGEDYRLLFAVPILKMEDFRRDFQTFEIIGHLALPEAGTVLVTPEGVELPLRAQGWKEEDED